MNFKTFVNFEVILIIYLSRIVLCKSIYNEILYNLAEDHNKRIEKLGECSEPKPELVYISHQINSEYRYTPRATILHRCSDRSGCCRDSDHSCQPVSVENVTLHFMVKKLNKQPNVECIQMVNHTKCDCLKISSTEDQYKSHDIPIHIPCVLDPNLKETKNDDLETKLNKNNSNPKN
jgi:hypothetical protein